MDIEGLVKRALEVKENAYAPYSGFFVGAALLTDGGDIYTGCNVENASYGAAICAERTAVVKAVSEGKKAFKAIAIASEGENPTIPCGICCQVLSEFCKQDFKVICSNKDGDYVVYTMEDLVPHPFDSKDLP